MSYKKPGLLLIVVCLPLFFYFLSADNKVKFLPSYLTSKKNIQTNPYLDQFSLACDSAFRVLMKTYNTPGASVTILYDTTTILLQGYGVKQINTADSIDIHTVYRLASVSKPFASMLTGILVQEGRLNWNDTVANHWSDFRLKNLEQTSGITIRHVLSHTTGLPYHTYTNLIEEGLSSDTLLHYLRDIQVASKPGEVYSYQNVGYSIIGKVIEQATSKKYENQLLERVFKPLGMTDASTDYITMLSNSNMAYPHLFKRGSLHSTMINDTYYNVAPAGGVNASIADMAKWLSALLGNRLDVIKKKTLDTLFVPIIIANSKNRNFNKWQRVEQAYYGLGWRVLHFASDTVIYHGGYVEGYRSEVAVLPKEKIAICVLSNAPGELIDNSIPVFLQLFDRYRKAIKNWKPSEDLNL